MVVSRQMKNKMGGQKKMVHCVQDQLNCLCITNSILFAPALQVTKKSPKKLDTLHPDCEVKDSRDTKINFFVNYECYCKGNRMTFEFRKVV